MDAAVLSQPFRRQPALVGRSQTDHHRLRPTGKGPRPGRIRGFCPGPPGGGTILSAGLEPDPAQAGLVRSFQVAFKKSLSVCHGRAAQRWTASPR